MKLAWFAEHLIFLQLASQGCIPIEDIPLMLQAGMPSALAPKALWDTVGEALVEWQNWCLQRGLLTYGIMSALYWRYLLPMPKYQSQLLARFSGVLADDVDEYPALMSPLFSVFFRVGATLLVYLQSSRQNTARARR